MQLTKKLGKVPLVCAWPTNRTHASSSALSPKLILLNSQNQREEVVQAKQSESLSMPCPEHALQGEYRSQVLTGNYFFLAQELFCAMHCIKINKGKIPTLTCTCLPFVDIQSIYFPTFTDSSKKKS